MQENDSTLLQPPYLGPALPAYPQIAQICRVAGNAILGTNIYPGYVQQTVVTTTPTPRDREACYVWEPNNTRLGPGIYDCRLVNSYAGLPLYATTCCQGGSSSSSSSG